MIHFAPLAYVYGAIAATALGLAVRSRRPWLMWGGTVMLASWLMSNEAVVAYGYPGFIKAVAVYDGVLAMMVAAVAAPIASKPLAAVFALFIAEEVAHVAFLVAVAGLSMNVSRGMVTCYVLILNIIFTAQCLVIGWASVKARLGDGGADGVPDLAGPRHGGRALVAKLARRKG